MKQTLICLCVALATSPAFAATCPAAPDHTAQLSELATQAQAAASAPEGRRISDQMWALWADAPDAAAQEILNAGMERRSSYDYLGAMAAFNRLIEYCPDYAEGYNQRAFVSYLREDFAAAVIDLDRALARSPQHVAALAGKALSLLALGQNDAARAALEQALALNPWIPERALAAPGAPLAPLGQDI